MIRFPIVASAALAPALFAATPALAGEVTITLTDVRGDAGDLYVSLQSEDQFMRAGGVAGEILENPQDASVTVTFREVPEGQYALMVWHDIDRNGTFGMGQSGPTDGWSMIGGAQLRGMPTFAQNSFTLDGDATITQSMIYPETAR